MTNEQAQDFITSYMKGIENILFRNDLSRDNDKEDFDKETEQKLSSHRKKISNYLQEEGLSPDDLDKINIKKLLLKIYPKQDLPSKIDDFIKTMFYSEVDITTNDIESFKEKIDVCRISQNIKTLYNFAFVSKEEDELNENDSNMRKVLTHAFHTLNRKDKAELFAILNVFFEKYMKDEVGNKHLELISEEYSNAKKENEANTNISDLEKENKNKELANNWIINIMGIANNSTPENISIDIDEKSNIKYQAASGSNYDLLYLIPFHNLNETQNLKLKEISNLDDFKNFKVSVEKTRQTQISARADAEQITEKNSILRHAFSNTIISKVINIHNIKYNGLLDDIINQDTRSTEIKCGNSILRRYITEAFTEVFQDDIFWKDSTDIKTKYSAILTKLTEDPLAIMSKMIGKQENTKFSKDDLQQFSDYRNDEISLFKEVITSKSFVSFYQENNILSPRQKALEKIQNKDPSSPLSDVNGSELDKLLQYSALLKYKELGERKSSNLTSESLVLFVEKTFNLRAHSSNNTVNLDNEKLSNKNFDDINIFILDNFIMSSDAEANQNFLIGSTKKNIDIIINDIFENRENKIYERLGFSETAIVDKIIKFKENGLLLPIDSRTQSTIRYLKIFLEKDGQLLDALTDNIYDIITDSLSKRSSQKEDVKNLIKIINKTKFTFNEDDDNYESVILDFIEENKLSEPYGISLCLNKIEQEQIVNINNSLKQ